MDEVQTIHRSGLMERGSAGGDREATATASVMVVTKAGEVLEAPDYALAAITKRVPGARQSDQVQDGLKRAVTYAQPRVAMSDLLSSMTSTCGTGGV